jgi:hypothetical protein
MDDNKQQQHVDARQSRIEGLQVASKVLSEALATQPEGRTLGEVFREVGLTLEANTVILSSITELNGLTASQNLMNALADAMIVGISLAQRIKVDHPY